VIMRFVLTLVTIVMLQGAVRADDTPDARQARAKALWEEGAAKYDGGRWDEAVTLFLEAYDVWPFPDILFNLCQAHRQLKNFDKALFYCRSYLRNRPDAPNHDAVATLIESMEKTAAAQDTTTALPPPGVEHPGAHPALVVKKEGKVRPWYQDRWGWAVVGGGLLVAGGGGWLLGDADDMDANARTLVDQDKRADEHVRAANERTIGVITTIAGGALIAAGVVKLALPNHERGPAIPATALVVGPCWLGVQGTF
jgi:tetratricopeptide (TPR) repeat protein